MLHVKPNDETGFWEIHDESGLLCKLESESTAHGLVNAYNMLPTIVKTLDDVFQDWITLVGEDLKENNADVKRIWVTTEAVLGAVKALDSEDSDRCANHYEDGSKIFPNRDCCDGIVCRTCLTSSEDLIDGECTSCCKQRSA